MTSNNDFINIEKQFHDKLAHTLNWEEELSICMSYENDMFKESDNYFIKMLGDVKGKRILDVGSGHGKCALNLSRLGADVTSIDIAPNMIEGCKQRAKKHDLPVEFLIMNACELKFEPDTYDLVVGLRTLHHLPDLRGFYLEALRVLKRGGSMIFVEPQKCNPFVEFGRYFIKNKDTDRTSTEHPFVPRDLRLAQNIFGNIAKREFEFLSVGASVFKDIINIPMLYKIFKKKLSSLDHIMVRSLPILKPFYWQVVFRCEKH